jgi:PhzF family phenazine biosynthesis protein
MRPMTRVPFRLVDVFAEAPFEGNQLCVLPESPGLDERLARRLANEIGFSETTWVLEAEPERYRMRIFTPSTELPFAGHPSLGTAYLLAHLGRTGEQTTQEVPAGAYRIEVDLKKETARMNQGRAVFSDEFEDRQALAAALGLPFEALAQGVPALPVSTGLFFLMVPMANADAVRAAEPRLDLVAEITRASGASAMYVFAIDGPRRATARLFGPEVGVAEDAATGAAAGPLGAYLDERGLTGELSVYQGENLGRPSVLRVDPRSDGVWVSGGVHLVGEGVFDLQDD